jgi:hypothetical protein
MTLVLGFSVLGSLLVFKGLIFIFAIIWTSGFFLQNLFSYFGPRSKLIIEKEYIIVGETFRAIRIEKLDIIEVYKEEVGLTSAFLTIEYSDSGKLKKYSLADEFITDLDSIKLNINM